MLATAAAVFLAAAAPAAPPARASVWVTARDTGDRLASKEPVAFEPLPQPDEAFPTIMVDPAKTFQEIEGFGGALTDAAAETFAKLPKERQRELLDAYFDPVKGIGYGLARTHINSCDFSSDSYAYAEPGDVELKTFSVAHDRRFRLPFIKAALATAKAPVKVYASPWSPPAWMKTNHDMLHGGKLEPEYRDAWARYYVRFVEEYEKEGPPRGGGPEQDGRGQDVRPVGGRPRGEGELAGPLDRDAHVVSPGHAAFGEGRRAG
jgi:glucosylceramidase